MMTMMGFKIHKKIFVCKPYKWYPGKTQWYICTYANMNKINEIATIIETQIIFFPSRNKIKLF